ncbi:MAG: methyltransferase domain-containing protein [Candidatus Bathyarchaeota archaeon]|nr:methyltransferase domain-containing protein [Candidatus Bathyarchaeota archaeon]
MSTRKGWNLISRRYQEKTRISLEDVHYGPISPGELELKLLEDVKGKDVLEIGCGGGQNAIVLSKWGAKSVGLDISEEQIRYARKLAAKESVKVPFFVRNMEDLSEFRNVSFDIVLSSFAIGYVENLKEAFEEVFRVLRRGGLFVFADVHPLADRGRVVRRGKRRIWGISNYFDRRRHTWTWKFEDGKVAKFIGRHRTIQDFFDLLVATGFVIEKILEPEPYSLNKMSEDERKRIPYVELRFIKNFDLWKRIPFTIIFKARKP